MRTTPILGSALVLSSLAAALSAQKVNEIEPNDTPATAMAISAGQHVVASYSSLADEDWYSFTLAAPGQVHVHTVASGTLVLGVSRDNRIAIYDAAGTTRLAWNDSAVGTLADCGATLPAGSYKARVGIKSGTVPAGYDLDFYVLPVTAITATETAEPNGATSATPCPLTLGQTVEGNLTSGDEDYWMFTLTGRGIVQAASWDDGGVPQLDNMTLQYNQGGPGAWVTLGSAATNSASHRVTSLSHAGMLAAGSYAISVKPGTAAVGTAPWDYVKTGQYSLRTCLIDMPGTATTIEGAEPNDNIVTPAGFVALGNDAKGNSSGSTGNGIDWYQIAVSGPTTIGAMAEGDPSLGAPLPGSSLRLWDSTGTISLASASGGATTHARLVFTIERAGIYYLQISGATTLTTGDYILHTGGCTPLYVSATTRQEPASTNACIGSNNQRPLFGNLSGELPAFGSTFVTRLERALPTTFVIYACGFTSIPPFTLGFGLPDSLSNPTPCDLRVSPDVLFLGLTDGTGNAELVLNFPYVPTDIGLKIFHQALCYDPTLNAFGFSLSNDASYVLGDRPF